MHEGETEAVTAPLVRNEGAGLEYLTTLLAADAAALVAPVPTERVPILQALARHSLLRVQAEAATRLAGAFDDPVDDELVDVVPGADESVTWARRMARSVPDGTHTVGDDLARRTQFDDPEVRELGEVREALAAVALAEPAQVEHVLPALLDAASHRLDAWITSLASRRLTEMRTTAPVGVLTGGYGWLEDVRYEAGVPVTEPTPDEPGPLVAPADDPGFVLAPSIGQATTAALLRTAHLAHGGRDDSPFAISLTSDRIRRAERLFDGVRQGQSLGTLLGYDVERRFHELHLDDFIDDVRRAAPPPGEDAEDVVQRRVLLDGLVLHEWWRTDPEHLLDHIVWNSADPRREKVRKVLAELDDAVDAAADAMTAESVHELARGNLARGAATLGDVARGQAPPPRLDLLRTPRTGTAVVQRVAIVLDATVHAPAATGWADPSRSVRAAAEPRLDAWAARMLGPATGVDVVVTELDDRGGVVAAHRVPLTDLGLSALDLVWISGDAGGPGELARRASDVAAAAGRDAPAQFLRLDLAPATDRSRRSLSDVLELAGAARRLLAGTRPLDGADLQPAHADPERGVDLDELESRVGVAHAALEQGRRAVDDLLDDEGATVGRYRDALRALSAFGVSGALTPLTGADADPASVGSATAAVATAVHAEVARRIAEADREASAPPDEPEVGRLERLSRRAQAVFGPGFMVVPTFTPSTSADLDAAVRSTAMLGDDPLAADTWLMRMERVRPALARMTTAYRLAEIAGTGPGVDLAVAQVPHTEGRAWVGLTLGEGSPADGLASIVLQDARAVDLRGPLAGLLVDEWTEVVPSRRETAGLAFRYDPPDAMAPQAVLLAVPPVVGQPWTVGLLNQVLLETLDLAHLRAVGPRSLPAVAHYLPATMLAFNAAGDVVSTDPNTLIG